MAIKQEPSEADLPGAGLHPDALQRTLDTVTSALPQLITAVTTLAQTAADMKRDAETTSTGLAAVLAEMKHQLTTVASAQLQTAAVLAEISTQLAGIDRSMAGLRASVQATNSSAQSTNTRLDGIAANSQTSVDTLRALKEASTVAKLQWALNNVQIARFQFHCDAGTKNSDKVLSQMLKTFIQGSGIRLPEDCYVSDKPVAAPTPAQRQAFRDALQKAAHELTGKKPRLGHSMQDGVMRWTIYRE